MKKVMIMLLALAMLLSMAACAAPETSPSESVTIPIVAETEAPRKPEPAAVEITMDNWQDYFELRDTEQVYINDACSVVNRVFGYGVFLKEEYVPRLAEGSDVSFELEYKVVWRRVMGDLNGDSYLIQGALADSDRKTQTAKLTDFRGRTDIAEDSDFYNSVAVEFAFDSEFGA